MDEIRLEALRQASIVMHGAPFTEIVRAAEAFDAFLRAPELAACAQVLPVVGQPSATDFAQADQSPVA